MPAPRVLVLLDIDGTLLDTQEAGILAYVEAGREVFGAEFSFVDVPLQGKLDHENYADAVARHCRGVDHRTHESRFRRTYREALDRIADRRGGFRPCPGVAELLDRLHRDDRFELGLLTGNWEETGRLKIRRAGLDDALFVCNAFADDGEDRDALVPVAMERCRSRHGHPPPRTVVVGDTPRDIRCALVGDAVPLGVATGIFSVDRLDTAGAAMAVETLEHTDELLAWILDESPE